MKFKDHYATLGIPRDATQDAIKNAYRKLARKYHPDVSREMYAEIRFKEVGEAYAILKDTAKRMAYDQEYRPAFSYREASAKRTQEQARPQPQAGASTRNAAPKEPPPSAKPRAEENFSNILDEMMGRPGSPPPKPRGVHIHGSDQHTKVQIDLEDTFHGTTRNVSMPTYMTDEYGMPIVSKRTLKVSIPKGMRSGQTLRLAGQGFPGTGDGKAGDLYLEIVIRPHRRYRVDGRDIYVDVPLTSDHAEQGTVVHVPTPEGSVQLAIPPGSSIGRKLRLKGKGIPGDPAGDMYAVITKLSQPIHTAVAQKAYRALKAAFDFAPRTDTER
ncbi:MULTISPECIES: DnaJ C-terminal domain-containing protein [Oxalobacteraceae]|uniref:DnaJ C-terminal domain-containing protein n=1 Tax=Herminiimonas sp. Marseille-P9896 TaxID=2742211 RepID=UPI001588B6F2|nr:MULTISPECIES: DnaJ C-terminal domain-containing protein [Oxalobacteraceae]